MRTCRFAHALSLQIRVRPWHARMERLPCAALSEAISYSALEIALFRGKRIRKADAALVFCPARQSLLSQSLQTRHDNRCSLSLNKYDMKPNACSTCAPAYLCMQSSTRSDYQSTDCYRICSLDLAGASSSNFQPRRTKPRRWGCLPASLRTLPHRTPPLNTFGVRSMCLAHRQIDDLKMRVLCARVCSMLPWSVSNSTATEEHRGSTLACTCELCGMLPYQSTRPDLGLLQLQILGTMQRRGW